LRPALVLLPEQASPQAQRLPGLSPKAARLRLEVFDPEVLHPAHPALPDSDHDPPEVNQPARRWRRERATHSLSAIDWAHPHLQVLADRGVPQARAAVLSQAQPPEPPLAVAARRHPAPAW